MYLVIYSATKTPDKAEIGRLIGPVSSLVAHVQCPVASVRTPYMQTIRITRRPIPLHLGIQKHHTIYVWGDILHTMESGRLLC